MSDFPEKQAPDSQWLYGFWYRALPGEHVGPSELKKAHVLGTPLVVGRDLQGRVFAMNDACPHRGMPLSCGWFDGEQLECSYHGWKFDARTGQCQLIPRSEEHTSELQSRLHLVCRLLLEKKKPK